MSIETRKFRPGDEGQILLLFSKVFNMERTKSEWQWRFSSPYLKDPLIRIAEDPQQKQVVGQYALIPIRLRIDGAVVPSALSLDTMVDQKYRGQGLFTRLANELFESKECRDQVKMLIGFPNEQSLPGFVGKLGWTLAGHCPLMIRPILFVETARKMSPRLAKYALVRWALVLVAPIYELVFSAGRKGRAGQVEPLARFDQSFDQLFARSAERLGKCLVHKDSVYMNWRYVDSAQPGYEIFKVEGSQGLEGVMVLGRTGVRGVIVDLICATDEAERRLLDFALSHFKSRGVAYILTWCSPHSGLLNKLKGRGFLRAKNMPFITKILSFSRRPMDTISDWHLMPGDNDTY